MATLATTTEKKTHVNADEKPDRKPHRPKDEKFKIFCGTANEALADEVCAFLGLARGQAHITRFKDGEVYLQIQENVRGGDVFVIHARITHDQKFSLTWIHLGQRASNQAAVFLFIENFCRLIL